MTEIVSLGLLRALMEAGFTNWCFDCCSWHQECYLTMKTLESVDTEQFQWQGKKNEARDRKLNLKAENEKLELQLIVVCCHTPPGRPLPFMWRCEAIADRRPVRERYDHHEKPGYTACLISWNRIMEWMDKYIVVPMPGFVAARAWALMEAGFTNRCFDCCSWHQACQEKKRRARLNGSHVVVFHLFYTWHAYNNPLERFQDRDFVIVICYLNGFKTRLYYWHMLFEWPLAWEIKLKDSSLDFPLNKKNEVRDRKLNLKAEKEKLEPQLIVERNVYGRKEKTVYFEIVVESLFYVLVSLGEAIADRRSVRERRCICHVVVLVAGTRFALIGLILFSNVHFQNAIPRYIGAFILICARCPDMITLRNLDILHAELLLLFEGLVAAGSFVFVLSSIYIVAMKFTVASYTLEDFGGLVAVGTYVFALSSIYTTAMKFTGAIDFVLHTTPPEEDPSARESEKQDFEISSHLNLGFQPKEVAHSPQEKPPQAQRAPAPRAWNMKLDGVLKECGFQKCKLEQAVYVKRRRQPWENGGSHRWLTLYNPPEPNFGMGSEISWVGYSDITTAGGKEVQTRILAFWREIKDEKTDILL
ncbi:hypothetical protein E3N88_37191 [Mikania micrantha]|uniref:Uncharacterized protein n=1 Tax=Mikania micrantha TaxID=192012 RepID=A0A5N6M6F4_9ASTR|nr:hypothetical protein E3N88_37191 [Mikania micrantha]